MVSFGHFPQMVTKQMAYLIYLIEVSGNKYQKATVFEMHTTMAITYIFIYVWI